MAEITYSVEEIVERNWIETVVWENVTQADTCEPVKFAEYGEVTMQVYGTFGGMTMALQGTLDPDNSGTYFTYRDLISGADAELTAAGARTAYNEGYWVRPTRTGGAGASVTVRCTFKAPRRRGN